jgi:NADPH:quinone reductase-like Zn-dependent oxidoreductase
MLRAQEGEAPAPRAGEVRIRQRAIGVNFIDIYLRRGWIPSALPLVPGMEAAGSVLDVGPQVGGLLPGDRVAYLGPLPGAYCGVRCVPADWVVRLPAAIEDEVAAALLLKGITADYLLRDLGRVQRGTRLLVHAAAGGVGLLVCAWARRLGATVLGTVSSEEKARVAREHGSAPAAAPTCSSTVWAMRPATRTWGPWPAAATGSAWARPAARWRRCRPMRWSPSR